MSYNPYKDIIKLINSQAKAKSIEERFLADVNKVIQLNKSKQEYVPSKTLKPSSLGACMRMQWFMLTGVEPDAGKLDPPELIGITESGSDRHKRIQQVIMMAKDFGVNIQWLDPVEEVKKANAMGINTVVKYIDGYEVLCYNSDYELNFKCDGIIIYDSKKMILEIKTEDTNKFAKRNTIEPIHQYQAVAYSLALGIPNIMFLYEDRNYCFKKAYFYTVSDEMRNEVKKRIKQVLEYRDKNIVPPKEKNKCRYCNYKQACKKLGD